MQDQSLQESMGPIVDRAKETLVSTDSGIIMARQRLLRALKAFTEEGVIPPACRWNISACVRRPSCCRPISRSRMPRASADRAAGRRARLGVAMQSESARMSTAAEARFRIQSPPPTNRTVKVIDLDATSDADVMRLIGEIPQADLVLMMVRAGGNTTAVRAIGTRAVTGAS